ncbi:unnamed protein product, partial [Cyprideis torosa]
MALGLPAFIPATPYGILEILKRYNVPTDGKDVLVIGRSRIVGLPISILLGLKNEPGNATVTMAHSRTKDLKEKCLNADIIVSALGRPKFLSGDM